MSLIKFYSKEDVDITGNPQFSFFDRTSPCFNYFRYIDATKRNQISRHAHFRLENIAYEEKNSNIYNINLTQLLNGYNLLGGIVITIEHDNEDEKMIDKIDLILDDVIFTYESLLLFKSATWQQNTPIIYQARTMTIINLPVPLFDNEASWIKLLTGLDITLKIKLADVFSIRVDFKVVKLDVEESRRHNIGQILTTEYYLQLNEIQRLNEIKDLRFDCATRYNQTTTYKCPINNLIITPIDNIHLAVKTLTWYYTINDDNILLDKIIKNVTICVKHDAQKLETKIKQDYHQLTISNQIHAMNKIIPGAYMYNFSLHPTKTHPSGDLFVNDYEIWIEHELNEEFLDKLPNTTQISIIMVTNEFRLMRYYLDLEQNKAKCKFIKLSNAHNKKATHTMMLNNIELID